jgi:Fe-S cluster biosynthesis and repair protein YggX
MADFSERIERFKFMADADPNNEMGHYNLAKAYIDAGQPAEAIVPLRRAIQINPNFARANHLLARSLVETGSKDEAIGALQAGIQSAHTRGEILPRNEMIEMLKGLGGTVPDLPATQAPQQPGEGEVLCRRCGRIGPKLAKPPFRNDFGRQIHESVCRPCWEEAIRMGTKVINELRLEMTDPRAQRIWDANVKEFLNLE